MTKEARIIETDVLVVGGGSAALWAAIRAKDFCPRVTLADKGVVASSGVSPLVHIINAPLNEEEQRLSLQEIVERSTYLCDQKQVAILMRELGDRFRDMEKMGVPFERDAAGKLVLEKRLGQKNHYCAFVNGREMSRVMRCHALDKGVQLVERVMVVDLLTSDGQHPTRGQVTGALGLNTVTGELFVFRAKAVILGTGLIGSKYYVSYTNGLTGDGQAMAFRAGADVVGHEYGQMSMFNIWERKFNTGGQAEYMRAGARILNSMGENIAEKYSPDKKASSFDRNTLSVMAAKEVYEGRGPIRFDLTHLTDADMGQLRRVLPSAMRAFEEEGIDLQRKPVECTPYHTYFHAAGVRVGLNSEASLIGLYAAGSATGGTGTTASGGLSQAHCFVSGYRAGEAAGRLAMEMPQGAVREEQLKELSRELRAPLERIKGPRPEDIYMAINQVSLPLGMSFFKHEKRMKTTLQEIARVRDEELPRVKADDVHGLVKATEARNFVPLTEIYYRCSLERKESRCGQYREDYPYRDDIEWLKWIVARREEKGMALRREPVPLDSYPFRPAQRLKIPVLIPVSPPVG
jgi:succinate dehydrogenase / fumarate reductase, flavoprotein subunit